MVSPNWGLAGGNALGLFQLGTQIGGQVRQQKDEREYKNALSAYATNPGQESLAGVIAVDPRTGIQLQQQQAQMAARQQEAEQQQATQRRNDLPLIDKLLGSITDEASYARAQQAAETAKANALETSYPDPGNVLTAGAGGGISIAAHTRVYGDGNRVPVNAGFVSGYAPGDYVTVYYVDAARTGGAVTYQATTGLVAQKDATHIVGQATIPQAGEPDAGGTAPSPPGYTPQNRNADRQPIE